MSSDEPVDQSPPERRIAAIVLPDLLCELGRERLALEARLKGSKLLVNALSSSPRRAGRLQLPLGVVLLEEASESGVESESDDLESDGFESESAQASTPLDAVNASAHRYGVRAGQTVAEACALVSNLFVQEVTRARVRAELGRVAEVALGFGSTVSIMAPGDLSSKEKRKAGWRGANDALDTVWVDVTGAAHLVGGEEALVDELAARVTELGHRARVALASGPWLARAVAQWGTLSGGTRVVPCRQSEVRRAVAALPLNALPLDGERVSWLIRLVLLSWGDLAGLPREAVSSRLGGRAGQVLELCDGVDGAPLVAYDPPSVVNEQTSWDDPVEGVEPLLFVLRGLISRVSQRLQGRGEAAQVLELEFAYDRSIARLRGVDERSTLRFELASPLWREAELLRVVRSRLEPSRLQAPVLGLAVKVPVITRALALQLDLARAASGLGSTVGLGRLTRGAHPPVARGPETLPVLLAELMADVGKSRVGLLQQVDAHRPEARSRFRPVRLELLSNKKAKAAGGEPQRAPTRLLNKPLRLEVPLKRGGTLAIDRRLYSIERVGFEQRLEGVEWWTEQAVSRDYLRLWLERQGSSGAKTGIEALVYVDRQSGERFLQAIYD